MIPSNKKNIAFIGYARPTMGSIAAIAEMQTWWICKYFENENAFNYRIRKPLFRTIDPLNLENEHINTVVIGCYYLKDLAKDLKIEPNMLYLLFTDFPLFLKIYRGSCHPMMYRIHGYKRYDNARQILMNTFNDKTKMEHYFLFFFIILHIIFIIFLIFIAYIFTQLLFFSAKIFKVKNKYLKYNNLIHYFFSIRLILLFYIFF